MKMTTLDGKVFEGSAEEIACLLRERYRDMTSEKSIDKVVKIDTPALRKDGTRLMNIHGKLGTTLRGYGQWLYRVLDRKNKGHGVELAKFIVEMQTRLKTKGVNVSRKQIRPIWYYARL